MTINETIQAWHVCSTVKFRNVGKLAQQSIRPSQTLRRYHCRKCLFVQDASIIQQWTSQLQDEHYPSGIGDIGLPMSPSASWGVVRAYYFQILPCIVLL